MPLLDLLFTMLWVYLLFLWIWLVVSVFIDIFRSSDLSGWGKAGWTIFVVVLPLFGVLVYLIARGDSMRRRKYDDAAAQQQATDAYIRSVASSGGSVSDELAKLAAIRSDGTLSEAEYEQAKSKVLA